MVTASTIATVTGVTLISGLVGYAVYFDYKRRNDPAFRARLRKDVKRTQRENKRRDQIRDKEAQEFIKQTVEQLQRPGALPDGPEREQTFSQQVQFGELLQAQGKEQYLPAAAAFYKALKVYPSPAELLMIYRQAVNAEVLQYVHQMVNADPSLSVDADPFAALARAANLSGQQSARLEEVDDEAPAAATAASASSSANVSSSNTNTEANQAPSVSSQEWEKVSRTDDDEKREPAEAAAASVTETGAAAADTPDETAAPAATEASSEATSAAPPAAQ